MITVGVPVYNGADMLGESLACLARQSRGDFVVLIHDNCSTDATPDIARAFCNRDPRFRYHRQPRNIGPTPNFIDVMEAAQTPYFLWRAHDDVSADNYIEALLGALEAAPQAGLAGSTVIRERIHLDGRREERVIPYRDHTGGDRLERLAAGLATLHQSWVYGLWRIETLRAVRHAVVERYPYPWAGDFLMLFSTLCRSGIAGTGDTWFRQRIIAKASQDAGQAAPKSHARLAEMRAAFSALCLEAAGAEAMAPAERRRLERIVARFTSRRVGSRRKLARFWLGERLGLKA